MFSRFYRWADQISVVNRLPDVKTCTRRQPIHSNAWCHRCCLLDIVEEGSSEQNKMRIEMRIIHINIYELCPIKPDTSTLRP